MCGGPSKILKILKIYTKRTKSKNEKDMHKMVVIRIFNSDFLKEIDGRISHVSFGNIQLLGNGLNV